MTGFLRWQFIMLSLGAACGSVQAADYPTEQDYLQDFPIVLSASRLSQPISETPNAMTVINRDMIVASGFRNIADLFKLVPGMYVGYEDGHTPIVSYRGTTDAFARRMQVLVDGRSVYLPLYGQVDWSELPLDIGDIERIEVIRGPSAASHGSNSVQGVISIFTRQASAAPKAQVSINRGEAGVSDVSARFGSAGENLDYRVTLASRGDDGFYGKQQMNTNDDSSTRLINTRINYRPTGSDSFDIQLGHSASTRTNGDINLSAKHQNTLRDAEASSDFQQITWLHTVHEHSDIQLSYYHMRRNTADNRPFYGTNFWIIDEAKIDRHDLELQHTLITSPANRIVWGVGMRNDSVDSPNNFLVPVTWKEYRIFAHDEWRITSSDLLNIGAMAEKNALGQTRVSPRAAYSHHLSPRHTLRASASVAYRNPEMIEELGNRRFWRGDKWWRPFTAAGGLSPERAFSREIGYIGQLDDAGSTLDIRVYHDQIKNIIWVDPVPSPDAFDGKTTNFKSLFTASHRGLESTLNYKFGAHSNLTVNYARQFVGADAAGRLTFHPMSVLDRYVSYYEKTVPQNSASLLLQHGFSGGMQLGVGFYHQDPVRVLDANINDTQPLTRRLDLRIAQRFGLSRDGNSKADAAKSGSGEIALVLQNALSDHYTDYNVDFINKRRAYLTATMEF
jgi:iron complex outermembrane receptor protein